MRDLIDSRGPIDPATDRRASRPDAWEALARAIVGQQLSTKAAASIWAKLQGAYGDRAPAPSQVLDAKHDDLRAAGLSNSKVAYLQELARAVESGNLDISRLPDLPDEGVIDALIEVKGSGRWTVEMRRSFHLGLPSR